jgi:glycosyltransferase involved in cell wall biosynthesis
METKKYSGMDSIVIYHDADPFYKNVNSKAIKPDLDIPDNYLLYVGRVFPVYKNIKTLLISYNKVIKNRDINLIMVHSDNYRKDDYNFILKNKLKIIDLKSLNRENVKYLYEHAFLTIYPSLYEGFGFPIIEAQSSGSPVLTTTYGPMPEVAGNGAIYFDGSSNDLYNKIIYIIKNEDTRKDLIEKGYKNSLRFSWHNTAMETMKVILND